MLDSEWHAGRWAVVRVKARRTWRRGGRLIAFLLTDVWVRLFAVVFLGLTLVAGFYVEDNYRSLVSKVDDPFFIDWVLDSYRVIAALLGIQPVLATAMDALTRRRLSAHRTRGVAEAMDELVARVRDLARVNTQTNWSSHASEQFQRSVLETTNRLMDANGMKDIRVCHFEGSEQEAMAADADDKPVLNLVEYFHHAGGRRPSDEFRREDPSCKGLFDAIDSGQPTVETDRPGYDPAHHKWRSAIRIAVQHDGRKWGVVTADSPKRKGIPDGCEEILEFGAALIAVARRCEDGARTNVHGFLERLESQSPKLSALALQYAEREGGHSDGNA